MKKGQAVNFNKESSKSPAKEDKPAKNMGN